MNDKVGRFYQSWSKFDKVNDFAVFLRHSVLVRVVVVATLWRHRVIGSSQPVAGQLSPTVHSEAESHTPEHMSSQQYNIQSLAARHAACSEYIQFQFI